MAPKSKTLLERPPPASSSEEQSSSGEEGGDETSSEEATPSPNPTAQKPQSSSSGESESESDSDDETDTNPRSAPAPDKVVKPLASKPMEKAAANKPKSKPSAKSPATPAAAKRRTESEPEKESKRAKKGTEGGVAEKSTPRIWNEGDQIALLKGMIEYEEKIGSSPSTDMEAFLAFIRKSKSLSADVTKVQLYEKVRRLKNKYLNNVEKLKKDESTTDSWKPHERKLFDLSKKIWRTDGNGLLQQTPKEEKAKSSGKAKKNQNQSISSSLIPHKPELSITPKKPRDAPLVDDGSKEGEEMENEGHLAPSRDGLIENFFFDQKLGIAGLEQYVTEKGFDMIEGPKRAELEERWAELRTSELELFVKRQELICEQAKMLLQAQK